MTTCGNFNSFSLYVMKNLSLYYYSSREVSVFLTQNVMMRALVINMRTASYLDQTSMKVDNWS
jgi:hypothetical protein